MNLIDNEVVEVLGEVYPKYDKYWVRVKANCGYWPHDYEETLMFNTEEEALAVKKGYTFLA